MKGYFSKCPECGVVFPRILDNPRCDDCREVEAREIDAIEKAIERDPGLTREQIAQTTGLDVDVVDARIGAIIAVTPEESIPSKRCVRCRDRMADRGSQHCFECRSELLDNIRRINNDLYKAIGPRRYGQRASRRMETVQLMQEKRKRSAGSTAKPAGWRKRYS